MPIDRTTAIDPAPRTHLWVHDFEIAGQEPGGTLKITFRMVDGFDSDPPNETWSLADSTEYVLTGTDAQDWLDANSTLYDDLKTAIYQKLIDDGVEAGTIE